MSTGMTSQSVVQGCTYDPLRPMGWSDLVLWLRRRLQRVRIKGESMLPQLCPGDEVLVDSAAYEGDRPEPGDLVIAKHPHQPDLQLIKRVLIVRDNGDCVLVGDNRQASTDSRTLGALPSHLILGQVRCHFF